MSLFDYQYSEEPRIKVQVTYSDDSTKVFDNEDWFTFKDGIRRNLQEKGLIKDVKLISDDRE